MNTQIIAIANQKGGVGKTTTCANLGIGLAQAGKKVLLIDGDPQGSLTISLGHPQPDKLPFTLSDAMGRILMDEPLRPGEGILHHPEGVDLMPADIQLSGMEVSLVNAMSRETILRQYLDTLKGQYSHILIDCQPSLGMLTVNALAAANRIIIPVQAEYLPAKGLEQLLSTVNKVKRQINPKLQIDGILLTMVDSRTNFAKEISALLRETYVGLHWNCGSHRASHPHVFCGYLLPCGGVQYHAQNQSKGAGTYIQIQPGLFSGTLSRTDQDNAF